MKKKLTVNWNLSFIYNIDGEIEGKNKGSRILIGKIILE